jgi:hypothetical protein
LEFAFEFFQKFGGASIIAKKKKWARKTTMKKG